MISTMHKIWQEGYDAHECGSMADCPYDVVTQEKEWDTWMDGFDYADSFKETV